MSVSLEMGSIPSPSSSERAREQKEASSPLLSEESQKTQNWTISSEIFPAIGAMLAGAGVGAAVATHLALPIVPVIAAGAGAGLVAYVAIRTLQYLLSPKENIPAVSLEEENVEQREQLEDVLNGVDVSIGEVERKIVAEEKSEVEVLFTDEAKEKLGAYAAGIYAEVNTKQKEKLRLKLEEMFPGLIDDEFLESFLPPTIKEDKAILSDEMIQQYINELAGQTIDFAKERIRSGGFHHAEGSVKTDLALGGELAVEVSKFIRKEMLMQEAKSMLHASGEEAEQDTLEQLGAHMEIYHAKALVSRAVQRAVEAQMDALVADSSESLDDIRRKMKATAQEARVVVAGFKEGAKLKKEDARAICLLIKKRQVVEDYMVEKMEDANLFQRDIDALGDRPLFQSDINSTLDKYIQFIAKREGSAFIRTIKAQFLADVKLPEDRLKRALNSYGLRASISSTVARYIHFPETIFKNFRQRLDFYLKYKEAIKVELIQGFNPVDEIAGDGEILSSGVCWGVTRRLAMHEMKHPEVDGDLSGYKALTGLDRFRQSKYKYRFQKVKNDDAKRCLTADEAKKGGFKKEEILFKIDESKDAEGEPTSLYARYLRTSGAEQKSITRRARNSVITKFGAWIRSNREALKKSHGIVCLGSHFLKGGGHAMFFRADEERGIVRYFDPNVGLAEFRVDEGRTFEEALSEGLEYMSDLYEEYYPTAYSLRISQIS